MIASLVENLGSLFPQGIPGVSGAPARQRHPMRRMAWPARAPFLLHLHYHRVGTRRGQSTYVEDEVLLGVGQPCPAFRVPVQTV